MILDFHRGAVLFIFILAFQAASAGKYDNNFSGSWRTTDGVVDGWDWTLPPGVQPSPRSGIFIATGFPSGYSGNKLKKVDTTWR